VLGQRGAATTTETVLHVHEIRLGQWCGQVKGSLRLVAFDSDFEANVVLLLWLGTVLCQHMREAPMLPTSHKFCRRQKYSEPSHKISGV
jgi:hypothetical protein